MIYQFTNLLIARCMCGGKIRQLRGSLCDLMSHVSNIMVQKNPHKNSIRHTTRIQEIINVSGICCKFIGS